MMRWISYDMQMRKVMKLSAAGAYGKDDGVEVGPESDHKKSLALE